MDHSQRAATPPGLTKIDAEPGSELVLEHQGPGSTRFVITTPGGDIFRVVLADGQTASFIPASRGSHMAVYGSDLDETIATRKH